MRTTPLVNEVTACTKRFDFIGYNMTKGRAIKFYCLDCMGNQASFEIAPTVSVRSGAIETEKKNHSSNLSNKALNLQKCIE